LGRIKPNDKPHADPKLNAIRRRLLVVLFNAIRECLVAKKLTRWSMKLDRELIALSKTRTLEAIAAKVQRAPESVLKRALRLGLTIER
jgi:hypothetical protein